MKEKTIVSLFCLGVVALVILGGVGFVNSTKSARDDQKFQEKYATERCQLSLEKLNGAEGKRIIEKYGTYTCYVMVNGIWTQLTDYDMDRILKIRQ